ncbi:unnamed protein product [Gemmata massiliana]|uniref:Uncharacterized protein n=1 Tax=Gemmata massiliana TaxID=1210884 RepID=A0A6P2CX90_9BACT|nr:hypothetical protein [Gemmata massiliana]VTR93569.1 unnamed protein product [Gemmata massiliana]
MANSAADVRAGGAWYELYGKDKLTPLLEKVKKNAESLGGFMTNVGKKAGAGIDMVLGGLKAKAAELAVQAVTLAARAVGELTTDVDKLRKTYEQMGRAMAQADQLGAMNMKKRGELIEAEIDPAKKKLAIEKEIARLEQERTNAQALKEVYEDKKDRAGTFKKKGTLKERWEYANVQAHGAIFGGPGLEGMENQFQEQINAANAARDKAFERLMELSDERGRIMNPDRDPEKTKAVAELTRELKKQAETFQKTAEEINRYEMKLKGFSKAQIAAVEEAQASTNRFVTATGAAGGIFNGVINFVPELTKKIEETTKALREQAETWGMTAEEAALYKLKLDGVANADLLAKAQEQADRIKMKNILGGAAEAIAGGIAGAEKLSLTSPGSFTAGNASQRFGADTIPAKQLKAAEQTAKNTTEIAKGISALGRALTFK